MAIVPVYSYLGVAECVLTYSDEIALGTKHDATLFWDGVGGPLLIWGSVARYHVSDAYILGYACSTIEEAAGIQRGVEQLIDEGKPLNLILPGRRELVHVVWTRQEGTISIEIEMEPTTPS